MKNSKLLFIGLIYLIVCNFSFAQVSAEMVINLNPSSFAGPHSLFAFNDSLWFVDHDGIHGNELWISDGTQEGSRLFADLIEGGGGSNPENLFLFNNELFFTAKNLSGRRELYKTDGTEAGIVKLGYQFGSSTPVPDEFVAYNNLLIYVWDSSAVGQELWRSDGTPGGTYLLKDIYPESEDSEPENLLVVNGILYFTAHDGTGRELWKTDGTESGTVMVEDINPTGTSKPNWLVDFNGTLYFAAGDGTNEYAIYKTDGITTLKVAVPDTQNTYGSAGIYGLTYFDGAIFFNAYDTEHDFELWRSDGTTTGTNMFIDIDTTWTMVNPGSHPESFKVINNKLFFSAKESIHNQEPWVTNGTVNGTKMIKNINASDNSDIQEFFGFEGNAFFGANDGVNGYELWTSDGAETGTFMIENLNGTEGGFYGDHVEYDSKLYFTGIDGTNGVALLKVINFSNVVEPYETTQFEIYPNPATSIINLKSVVCSQQSTTVALYDLNGRKLLNKHIPAGSEEVTVDVSGLESGVYFCRLIMENKSVTKKLIINK